MSVLDLRLQDNEVFTLFFSLFSMLHLVCVAYISVSDGSFHRLTSVRSAQLDPCVSGPFLGPLLPLHPCSRSCSLRACFQCLVMLSQNVFSFFKMLFLLVYFLFKKILFVVGDGVSEL